MIAKEGMKRHKAALQGESSERRFTPSSHHPNVIAVEEELNEHAYYTTLFERKVFQTSCQKLKPHFLVGSLHD